MGREEYGVSTIACDQWCVTYRVKLRLGLGGFFAVLHMGGYVLHVVCFFCDVSGIGRPMRYTECYFSCCIGFMLRDIFRE